MPGAEWSRLFSSAFAGSRNAMVLLDGERRHVDVNGAYLQLLGYRREDLIGRPIHRFIEGGPVLSEAEWRAAVAAGRGEGDAVFVRADGGRVRAQWAGTAEVITGRSLVLLVALSTSRWGQRFRRNPDPAREPVPLSRREREVVALIALGNTGPEIAEELHITHDTVRTHARNAMEKIGARSRAHLVAKAVGEGYVFG